MGNETISAVELIWSAIALIGLGASSVGASDAYGDFKNAKIAGIEGPAAIAARMNLRNEGIRFSVLLVFLLVGVVAMFVPNESQPFTVSRASMIFGLIGSSGALVWGSWADRRDRRRIIAELEKRNP